MISFWSFYNSTTCKADDLGLILVCPEKNRKIAINTKSKYGKSVKWNTNIDRTFIFSYIEIIVTEDEFLIFYRIYFYLALFQLAG